MNFITMLGEVTVYYQRKASSQYTGNSFNARFILLQGFAYFVQNFAKNCLRSSRAVEIGLFCVIVWDHTS